MISKDDLLDMASGGKYLPGVYNYCDRWCERCPFSDRCMNYAMEIEAEIEDIKEEREPDFMTQMTDVFQLTFELIEDLAKREGIDLDQIRKEPYVKRLRENIDEKPVYLAAKGYRTMVFNWLEKNEDMLRSKETELINLAKIGMDEDELEKRAVLISNSFEVIHHHLFFIEVKIKRALHGKYKEDYNEEYDKENTLVSSKLALITADESRTAWENLLIEFEDEQDMILEILAALNITTDEIKGEFPEAEKFKRPYFD